MDLPAPSGLIGLLVVRERLAEPARLRCLVRANDLKRRAASSSPGQGLLSSLGTYPNHWEGIEKKMPFDLMAGLEGEN